MQKLRVKTSQKRVMMENHALYAATVESQTCAQVKALSKLCMLVEMRDSNIKKARPVLIAAEVTEYHWKQPTKV